MELYIGNLSYLTTEEVLAALLAPYALTIAPRLALDPTTGLSRGYALATVANDAAGASAIEGLNGTILDGRIIIVRAALPGQ